MTVTVTKEQVKWLMDRHKIPQSLEELFCTILAEILNNSNFLDGAVYRSKEVLKNSIEAMTKEEWNPGGCVF